MEVVYISYEEAQKLIPFFQTAVRDTTFGKGAQESAQRILSELKLVRGDISYATKGRQIILRSEQDRDFLMDAIGALQVR